MARREYGQNDSESKGQPGRVCEVAMHLREPGGDGKGERKQAECRRNE